MNKTQIGILSLVVSLIVVIGRAGFADDYDRSGKLGFGAAVFSNNSTTAPGLGLRYWFSDRIGADLSGYYLSDSGGEFANNHFNGGSASLVVLLKKKNGLRLEGLLGPSYDYTHTLTATPATQTTDRLQTLTLGAGLGAEYSFQELPDLGLAAAVTGFGASANVHDVSQTTNDRLTSDVYHDTYWTYATRPEVSLVARYYF